MEKPTVSWLECGRPRTAWPLLRSTACSKKPTEPSGSDPRRASPFSTEDEDGDLWLGTHSGLQIVSVGTHEVWDTSNGLASNIVRTVYIDREEVAWIGTYGGGLYRLDGGHLSQFGKHNGLHENVVSMIIEDRQGRLWMTGIRGVSRASKSELKRVAEELELSFQRSGECVTRYGGEEFAVIVPDASTEEASSAATRFIERLEALRIPQESSPVERWVTASIGISTENPCTGVPLAALVLHADRALYRAKKAGRNRCHHAGDV